MKGVVLAGGLGTRLRPLTLVTNKHLLPVFDLPMVYRPIQTLVDGGIKEIMIVSGGPHAGHFIGVLKNGEDFGLKHLSYAYQKGEGGIADALKLAEDFADGESIAVILGDNCTDADISKEVRDFKSGATIFLKEVPDPERFGVATLYGKEVINIVEKPSKPESNFAVTGLYLYDPSVFEIIRGIKPSGRGELEITDVNMEFLRRRQLKWSMLNGYWRDAGTFETLFEVGDYWRNKNKGKERG